MYSALFNNESLLYNHPNEILRKFYRTTIKEIWPMKLFIILRWSIYAAVVVFFISIFIHVHETQKDAEECIRNPKCSLVFMNYYHLPWNERKYYWAANIQNVSFGGICGVFAYYRDVYISSFIILLRCKLRMLSYVIGHLNEFVDDLDLKHYDWLLKECVEEHQRITRFVGISY
ncbi:hypothetical protein WA026_007318 [Henosepilachna vigintioctopunctata]|uniref:Odorant receptor n=1 Tax=Henosepilachna vigintioctopunctata TaxID=420089 RepID=A0AAW1UTU3_9CUCU